jgi:predicted transcriptional regulator
VLLLTYSHIRLSADLTLLKIKLGRQELSSGAAGSSKLNSHQLQFALLKREKIRNNLKRQRRGKLDIIAEILLYCEQQKTKTSIMYNTNLNYSQLKSHMDTLTTQGLLAKKQNKYATTEKGHRFLELFAQLNDLLEEITP